jgi:hypothetical protein
VDGEPFSRELQSAFGAGEVIWSLADGELPPGISVDPKGLLTGISKTTGDFIFTLKAVDAQGTAATRKLKLTCEPESRPEIPEQKIPVLGVGEYIHFPVEVNGGNGDITWRLEGSWVQTETGNSTEWKRRKRASKHMMVPGMELIHTGYISGSPAQQGTYRLKLLAADSDPNEPDTATRDFIISVGLPGPGACLSGFVEEGPELDGSIDRAFGTLDCSVKKPVKGDPSCSALFSSVYDRARIYLAVQVRDDKIVTGSDKAWEDDSIEVYFDKKNNHEKEYNSDDCRIVCSVSGKVYTYNVEAERVTCAFKKTETGYTAEICIRLKGRRKPNTVYGFDLGINDNDGRGSTGRIMWHGTAENETDTSGFGALVFQEAAQ